ncbi:MAG: nucleotide exchange factor GrpE [Rhodospirillales bacterium]
MSAEDEKQPFGDAPDQAGAGQEQASDPSAAQAEKTEKPGDDPAPDAETRAAALETDVADLKDKLLRALAETENVRRRAARDKDDANKYAIASFAREMVEVRDNLRRALDAVDESVRGQSEAVGTLLEGIEMTERSLLATFERFGIRPIEALQKKFDHNFHEALFEVEDRSVPAGTVVQELQPGYKIHDRLLRPAKVGVSKGGAKEAPGGAGANADEAAPESDPESDPSSDSSKTQSAKAYEKSGDPAGAGGKLDEKL